MFQHSVDLQTTPEKALDRARVLFTYGGLKVVNASHHELTLTGTGLIAQNQNRLLTSITSGHISAENGRLEIKAELGFRSISLLVIVPTVFLLMVALIAFLSDRFSHQPARILALIPMAMIFYILAAFLHFVTKRMVEKEVIRALNTIAAE